MMLRFISTLAIASFTFPAVSGLDVEIKDVKCESRAVRAEFSYICDQNNMCTFGERESLEGDCK